MNPSGSAPAAGKDGRVVTSRGWKGWRHSSRAAVPSAGPLLEARNLTAGYQKIPIVRDLNLTVEPGEVVALLGANGAGKTTTLLTLAGAVEQLSGVVLWRGSEARTPLHIRARQGLRLVTEERSVFMSLSGADNVRLGGMPVEGVEATFPELRALMARKAGSMSGGEQQMLTLARALGPNTKLLLADELSLGLAPRIAKRLLLAVRAAANHGMGALVVEQHVRRALEIADRAYILQRGRVVVEGTASELRERETEIIASYLSRGEIGRDQDTDM
jgi:branched-chain amino acid transport system ATP-binding protein